MMTHRGLSFQRPRVNHTSSGVMEEMTLAHLVVDVLSGIHGWFHHGAVFDSHRGSPGSKGSELMTGGSYPATPLASLPPLRAEFGDLRRRCYSFDPRDQS